MIEEGLYSHLSSDGNITALVSTRIYPEWMPQEGTLPALVFSRISSPRRLDMEGSSGYMDVRMRVDCYASSYSAVKALADAVRVSLNNVTGTLGGESVQRVMLLDDRDLGDVDGDAVYRRVALDFMVVYQEA